MSLFEKIVAGQIPCHKLYEDEHTFAFLDIAPVAHGHALLIPKHGYEQLDDLPPHVAAALGTALPKLAAALKKTTRCDGLNILQNNGPAAGQDVPHVHFHLIPRYANDRTGLRFDWPAGKLTDQNADDLTAKITAALGQA